MSELPENFSVYQLFSIRCKKRDALIKHLEKQGIMTKIYFSPVHITHFYKDVLGYSCPLPVTDKISDEIISLPIYPGISREDIDYVIRSIKAFYKEQS
jgi:perosamine synthetase